MNNGLLITGLCLVWGATWVAIKIGLTDSPPFYGAAIRFILASVILGAIVWRMRKPWPRRDGPWGWMVVAGVMMYFGSYATTYYVSQYINAALAAILFASFPFFVAIGAHFYLPDERLTPMKVVGLVIGFAGVVVVFGQGATAAGTLRWWAPALMIVSPLISSAASLIVKKHLTREDPVVVNCFQMALGAMLLLTAAITFEDFQMFRWTAASVGAIIFLALFGSIFTFVTYYHLLRTMEATKLSLIAFVTPVVASILGWLILGETLSASTMGGAALVMAGVWIVANLGETRRSN